jgi:hypothetical protein
MEKNAYVADTPQIPAEMRGSDSAESDAVKGLLDRLGSNPAPRDEEPSDEGRAESDEALETEDDETPAEEADEESPEESDADEEQDDSGEEEPEAEESLVEVTLPGGEKAKVTLDELTKGYSRQKDYTRKTQELSAKAKEIEAEKGQTQQERERYVAGLTQLEQILKDLQPQKDAAHWDQLRKDDPGEFAAQWAEEQQRQKDLAAVQAEKARAEEKTKAETLKQQQARLKEETDKLRAAWPEFTDEKKGPVLYKQVHDYLTETYGLTKDEIEGMSDHRFFLLVRDAMFGHEVRTKGTSKLKGNLKEAPKVLPPGTRKPAQKGSPQRGQKERDALRKRLARDGRADDAVALVAMRLASED